jgi:hypothetical protein
MIINARCSAPATPDSFTIFKGTSDIEWMTLGPIRRT